MIKGKDIAMKIRDKKQVIVKKKNENEWIISDTYIMIIVNNNVYNNFRKKWNSYKSTIDIPKNITEYTITEEKGKEESPNFDLIIPNQEEEEVYNTNIAIGNNLLLKSKNNKMILINTEYQEFIQDNWYIVIQNENKHYLKPIKVYDPQDNLKLLIMPVRPIDKFKNQCTPKELIEEKLNIKI